MTQIEQIFQFLHVSLKLWVDVAWKLKQRCSEGTPTKGLARRRFFRVLTRTRGYGLQMAQLHNFENALQFENNK